ncbi:hypothetical protein V5O48_016036 [Marasmius crinis-equi]|uniref:Uncharacterized protein n=1 Tax=Marasmius crinis-equi TaxID=585013 RepID=A0ABR3ESU2_9AGAR
MGWVTNTVRITYSGIKATFISPDDPTGALEILRRDLKTLKLPQPPTGNTSVVALGMMEYFWSISEDSPLSRQLNQLLRTPLDPQLEESFRTVSIENMQLMSKFLPKPPLIPESPSYNSRTQSAENKSRLRSHMTWTRPGLQPRDEKQETKKVPVALHDQALEFLNDIKRDIESQSAESTSVPPRSRSPTPPTSFPLVRVPPPRKPPHPADALVTELIDIRKKLIADLTTEKQLIEELKLLNAPNIPEPSPSGMMSAGSELVFKARLKLVEEQIEEERMKKRIAENTMRECHSRGTGPFVVPALLDAFVMLSKLSSL